MTSFDQQNFNAPSDHGGLPPPRSSMVCSISLLALSVIGVLVKWLWKWLPSLLNKSPRKDLVDDDVTHLPPYPCEPIKGRRKFHITMGLRKLDEYNWLTIDKNYMREHEVRLELLQNNRENVIQYLPESYAACEELLEMVTNFLCSRFPTMFKMKKRGRETEIHNLKTNETFTFGGANPSMHPLEIAVRLTMEDLSVLMKNADGEYYLAASATLFPVGWTVHRRIGFTLSQLHGPVPQWNEKIGRSVHKFMCRLTPKSPMERSNYFLETKRTNEDLCTTLFRPDSLMEEEHGLAPSNVILRRERQTFRRLPRTQALLFTVKTTLSALDELSPEEVQNLAAEIVSWPDDMAKYKGRDVWGRTVLEYAASLRDRGREQTKPNDDAMS